MSDANLARLVVSLEANMDKFQKSLDTARKASYGAAGEIKQHLDEVDSRWSKLFGHSEPGKALDTVFSRSRLALIEEGAVKIPLFGAAVEELGPIGLAASAGLAALFLTMEQTEKAVEWAANLGKVGKEVGVTTDFLQQFNFAAKQNEIDTGKADEALKGLNVSLGLVQSGLAKKQLANAFAALGFTPEQLRQYNDVGQLFPVLAQRIAELGNASEQAAIARRLGIEELIPMLKGGADGFNELANKARDLGIVMDASAIEKAEKAKEKLNELDQVMKDKANISFAEFADTLVSIKEKFLDAETAGLRFLAAVTGTTPKDQLYRAFSQRAANPMVNWIPGLQQHDQDRAAELLQQMVEEAMKPKEGPEAAVSKAKQLVDPTAKKGPKDDTQTQIVSVNEAIAAALRAQLEAEKALTDNVQARAEFERQAIQQQLAQQLDKIEKQKISIEDDKGISAATKKTLVAKLSEAETAAQKTAQAKIDLLNRQTDWALEDQADETRKELRNAEIAQLQLAADLATTQAERNRIEEQIRKLKEDELLHEQAKTISRAKETGQISDPTAAARWQAAQDTARAQRLQTQNQAYLNANPLAQYGQQVQDLNKEFQQDGVQAITAFSDGLANAIVNAQSAGDAIANVFKQLLAQILSQSIQKFVMGFVPGFAGGTDFAPGGAALVGEHGPELVNLPRGSQVVPNAGLSSAIGGGSPTYHVYQLQGAVLTNEIWSQISAAEQRATVNGAAAGYRQTMTRLQQTSRQRLS